jgi:hypothetical protein
MANTINFKGLNQYLSAKAADDFNRFLEKVPQNAGKTALMAGALAWAAAAALGLFSMLQTQKLTELRGQLEASENLQPVVPVLTMVPVPAEQVKAFADRAKTLYPGLTVDASGNVLTIRSPDTSAYAQFREILGHVVSGGAGWKVSVNSMCVGRECAQNAIDASLRIEKINIDKPPENAPSDVAAPPGGEQGS